MSISRGARLLRWSACAALVLGAFEACSNSGDSPPPPFNGPSSVDIATAETTLGCDDSLVVHVTLTNFHLKPPDYCGTTPQCGSLLVTLRETEDGPALLSQRAATSDVQLDLTDLVTPKTADGPTLRQVHFLRAELYGDSLQPFVVGADGVGSAQIPVALALSTDCAGEGGASSGGAAGAASSDAGGAGMPAGQAGDGSGGVGTGGTGGTGATGGDSGSSGTSGSGGSAGGGGTAGTAGG